MLLLFFSGVYFCVLYYYLLLTLRQVIFLLFCLCIHSHPLTSIISTFSIFFLSTKDFHVKSTQKVPKHDHLIKCPSDLENGSLVALIESILMQKNKTIGSKVTESIL